MNRPFDSVLILVIAGCVVAATGVTIHDANAGKPNPLEQRISSGVRSMKQWFSTVEADSGTGQQMWGQHVSSANADDAGTSVPQPGSVFGQHVLVPTLGDLLP